MRRTWLVLVIAVAAVLVPASASSADSCEKRDDIAALDQYCPGLPGADGRAMGGPPLEAMLPAALVERLRRAGPLGEALLRVRVGIVERLADRRTRQVVDARDLLARGALGQARKPPDNPGRVAARALSGSDANWLNGFSWTLLLVTLGLAGASWVGYRGRLAAGAAADR